MPKNRAPRSTRLKRKRRRRNEEWQARHDLEAIDLAFRRVADGAINMAAALERMSDRVAVTVAMHTGDYALLRGRWGDKP